MHGDWRDTREALEAAYREIGEDHPGNIPDRDWKLAEALRDAMIEQRQWTCVECNKPIPYRSEIVCLDCGGPLHRGCAPSHFWPNGRPKKR